MSLATTYDGKLRVINNILSEMSPDERKMMLQSLIKKDMKTYFEVIWDEQKRLETEAGVEGVCEFTSDKAWADGEEIEQNAENDTGLEVNLAGKVSKEAENAYYFDEKPAKNDKNDRYDGFLGYVNQDEYNECCSFDEGKSGSGNDENEGDLVLENSETEPETTLEPGEFMDKISEKIEEI